MLDTSHDLRQCERELKRPCEQLLTPLTRYKNRHANQHFAIDNGAFSRFNEKAFRALLEREWERKGLCRFVAAPDVVGDARRTLEVFNHWRHEIIQWPLALVCQDGQEHLPIPWDDIDAIFVGGSTKWKESNHAIACIKAAQALGKWVHVGRVNDPGRLAGFEALGVDSVDGSGIARYTWMRERIGEEPALFDRAEMVLNVETAA